MKETIGPLLTMINYPTQCAQRSADDTLYVQEFVEILRGEPVNPGGSVVFREQAPSAPRAKVQAAPPRAPGKVVQPKQKKPVLRRRRVPLIIAAVVLFACAAALSVLLLAGRNADTPEESPTPTPTATATTEKVEEQETEYRGTSDTESNSTNAAGPDSNDAAVPENTRRVTTTSSDLGN